MTSDNWLPTIGLEVHAQLLTESKMFCDCDARYAGAPPNSHVCPVDLGLPGSLPTINQEALRQAILVGLALHCTIAPTTRFDRKNYPYPDIPKGYQISQYDMPIALDGHVDLDVAGETQRIGIVRAHLEEDTGKSLHSTLDGREVSLIDYNRSGVPLLEIVSQPDLHSAEAARTFFATLREMLIYLGVNSGDLQEGALRADVNVSVRREGRPPGVKVEIKNLNSFRAVEQALEFEIERQVRLLEAGESLTQETRGWDEAQGATVAQRSKEFAEDYRYFPEPDLPPLRIPWELIDSLRSQMPELRPDKRKRLVSEFGLSEYDAGVLTQDPAVARLFEATTMFAPSVDPKMAANWLTGEFLRLLNETQLQPLGSGVTAEGLAAMLGLIKDGTITNAIGKTVFEEMFRTGRPPIQIITDRHLAQIDDLLELETVVRDVLANNPNLAADYVAKDRKTEGPLVGKVMAATTGKANATRVKEVIAEILLGQPGPSPE